MSVTVIHPTLNKIGGAERICLGFIKVLREDGCRVTLTTIEKTEWHFLEERFGPQTRPHKEEYLVERLPENSLAQIALTLLFFTPMLVLLRMRSKNRLIVNTYGDLVDSIADISYVNAVPIRVAHRFRRSGLPDSFPWRFAGQAYDFALGIMGKLFVRNIVLTNSTFMQNILKEFLGLDSIVVYPPVDLKRFISSQLESERKDLVVTVSRLRPGKNLELIPRIAKLVDKVDFVLFGIADEASKYTISKLAESLGTLEDEDRVKLMVNQSAKKLVDILASAKVFLHAQATEGFGIAIVEAMASGCVPIVPKAGGPWYDILDQRQGEYGYSYMTTKQASETIKMLIADEKLRTAVSARAAKRAQEFGASRFENAISRLLKRVHLQGAYR